MKIAITGHRPSKLGNDYNLTSSLILAIKAKIMETLEHYDKYDLTLITGMALGIDTLFARIVIEYEIPFIAAIPCKGQDSMWRYESKKEYLDIISNPLCTQHFVTEGLYTLICMQLRNEWMVDNSDILIAVWDGTSGGTANCVKYAEKQNKFIIRINPNDFK